MRHLPYRKYFEQQYFKIAVLCILCIFSIFADGQTPIADSLKQHIYTARNSEEKLKAIILYCDEFQSLNRDTVYFYAQEAMRLAKDQQNTLYQKQAELAFANAYFVWGWVDSTLYFTEKGLENIYIGNSDFRKLYLKLMRQKSLCYGASSRFAEALDILHLILKTAKATGDSATTASALNTIGSIQILLNEPDNALTYILEAKKFIHSGREALLNLANINTNLAYAHF